MAEEDPNFYCDKAPPSRGKNKGMYCGRNLNHKGNCGDWFADEDRETRPDGEPAEKDNVIPFTRPEEAGEYDEPAHIDVPQVVYPQQADEEKPPPVKPGDGIEFNPPASAPVFADPPLRSWGKYKHPVTGEEVPGVTSISGLIDKSGFLVPWSAKMAAEWAAPNLEMLEQFDVETRVAVIKRQAKKLRDNNKNIGSLAHNTVEALLRGQDVRISDDVRPQVEGFMEWQERFVERVFLVEETVWSHRFKYAGTLDLGCIFKTGEVALVDIKTGKDVYAEAAMQLVALARADVIVRTDGEFQMPAFNAAGVLHLPQPVMTATGRQSVRGQWSYRPVYLRDVDMDSFLALKVGYTWEHEHSSSALGPKQTQLPSNMARV